MDAMDDQGNVLYLDENSDVVQQEMNEQMQEHHNRTLNSFLGSDSRLPFAVERASIPIAR